MKTVTIDLGPTSSPAPGTARHVAEQARRVLAHPVSWRWKVLVDSPESPLYDEFAAFNPEVVGGRSRWRRAVFSVGRAAAGTDLLFATAYFVPFMGTPVVANFFDSNIYEHFDTWVASGRLANALLIRALSNIAVYRANRLFVNSNYCADYLRKKFPRRAAKFVVTPPGCSTPPPAPAGHRPAWADSLREPFLLYVGTFSENKNQRRLIEAYTQLQADSAGIPPLVIIGPCERDFMNAAIAPAMRRSPAPTKLVLPGKVSDPDLAWAYANALAYIQPSIAEGFGLPVVEAMSHGLPVACSHTTSLPETAGGAALLFDPFSPSSIGEALRKLALDETLRASLRKAGDIRWRKFTWESNALAVIGEIDKVLGSRRG